MERGVLARLRPILKPLHKCINEQALRGRDCILPSLSCNGLQNDSSGEKSDQESCHAKSRFSEAHLDPCGESRISGRLFVYQIAILDLGGSDVPPRPRSWSSWNARSWRHWLEVIGSANRRS